MKILIIGLLGSWFISLTLAGQSETNFLQRLCKDEALAGRFRPLTHTSHSAALNAGFPETNF